ncbi:hypothetical protein J6590_047046 [Homalodisca vitripennis]|nr:hypothetical protein J6590_047046 [Homalodisca vitripennis]
MSSLEVSVTAGQDVSAEGVGVWGMRAGVNPPGDQYTRVVRYANWATNQPPLSSHQTGQRAFSKIIAQEITKLLRCRTDVNSS